MEKGKMKHYEDLLLSRLKVLTDGHEEVAEPEEKVADELDLSVLKQGQYVDISLGSIKRAEISAIQDAIQRCRDGEYGICEDCGKEIPEKRLEVNPAGKCCVSCQSRLEKLQQSKKGYLGLSDFPEMAVSR